MCGCGWQPCALGDVRVKLRDDLAPTVAGYFQQFAQAGTCGPGSGCQLYRSEAVPVPGRGLHSSTFQLNLSSFGHTSSRPPV